MCPPTPTERLPIKRVSWETRPAKISEHSLSKAEHHVKDDLFKLRAFLGDLSAYEKMILRLQHDIEILVDLKAITLKLAHTLENFSRED
jgi:hypothetical protein